MHFSFHPYGSVHQLELLAINAQVALDHSELLPTPLSKPEKILWNSQIKRLSAWSCPSKVAPRETRICSISRSISSTSRIVSSPALHRKGQIVAADLVNYGYISAAAQVTSKCLSSAGIQTINFSERAVLMSLLLQAMRMGVWSSSMS